MRFFDGEFLLLLCAFCPFVINVRFHNDGQHKLQQVKTYEEHENDAEKGGNYWGWIPPPQVVHNRRPVIQRDNLKYGQKCFSEVVKAPNAILYDRVGILIITLE